jgi:hypothetical protein
MVKFISFIVLLSVLIGCNKATNTTNIPLETDDTLKNTGGINDPIAEINSTPEIVLAYRDPFPASLLLDMPPAKNQGSQGSCGAWATVYYLHSYLKHIAEATTYSNNTLSSPSYTFNQLKQGNCGGGSGAIVHLAYLKNQGACSLADMPYTAPSCSQQPNASQRASAANNKISQYFKINRHNENLVKTLLNLQMPIVNAIASDNALHNLPTNNVWIPNGVSANGHMVTMCGYTTQGYTFINSWGRNWGNEGRFHIPYNDFSLFPKDGGFVAFWASNPAFDDLNRSKVSEYLLNGNANNTGGGTNALTNNLTATTNRKMQANSAVLLNGSNSVICANENLNTNGFSVSMWFNKSNSLNPKQTILSQVDKQLDANNNIDVFIENDTLVIDLPIGTSRFRLDADSTLQNNSWYHLVYTYDNKFLKFYLNGKVIKFAVYMNYFKNTNTNMNFGCTLRNALGVNDNFFVGKFDDIRIYSRAIKETEVDKLFLE